MMTQLIDLDGVAEWRAKEKKRRYDREYMKKYSDGNPEYKERSRVAARKRYQNKRLEDSSRKAAKHRDDPRKLAFTNAKQRAKNKGCPFSLASWEALPHIGPCEACGCKLVVSETGIMQDTSPTLDRVVPSIGYVIGNLGWLCRRCNTIKSDAGYEEILKVAEYVKRMTS